MVFETGRSARIDDYRDASGELGAAVRERGAVTLTVTANAAGGPRVTTSRRLRVIATRG